MFNAGILEGIDTIDDFKTLGDNYIAVHDKIRAEKYYRQALYLLEKDGHYEKTHPRVSALHQLIYETTVS